MRSVLAVVLGFILGGVFNMAMVTVSTAAYPLPEGVDPNDFEAFQAHVQANGLPTGAFLIVLLAHAGGSLVSGLVCGFIAKRRWYLAALGLGAFWTAGGIYMLTQLPAPIWFAVVDTVLYIPAALFGVHLAGTLAQGNSAPNETATA